MFKLQLNIAQEEIEINTKLTKAAKDIQKKAKNVSLEDMTKLWKEKPLHGKYPLRTDNADIDRVTTHQRISSSSLKGDIEGFILAAQDQSVSIPAYQSRILNNCTYPNCRLYTEETVDHIVSGCPTIVNTNYLKRHDELSNFIHWMLCKNFNVHLKKKKWHENTP